jgi:hypothetical protein
MSKLASAWVMALGLILPACGDDDGGDIDAGADASTEADSGVDNTACAAEPCDPATEYCHEHTIDGPSEYTCEPLPEACSSDPSCECVEPILAKDCETVQACAVDGDGVLQVDCVEG